MKVRIIINNIPYVGEIDEISIGMHEIVAVKIIWNRIQNIFTTGEGVLLTNAIKQAVRIYIANYGDEIKTDPDIKKDVDL